MARDQLRDEGVDRHQLHADADAGDEAPQVDAEAGGLERHDQRAGGVPEQGEGEDEAPAIGVGDPAEGHGAEPQAGEQREHEGAGAGHLERRQDTEDAEGVGREQACLGHAGDDIGGQEQVVEFEAGAQRDQDNQLPHVATARQAVEPGGQLRRGWGGHHWYPSALALADRPAGAECGDGRAASRGASAGAARSGN